LAKERAKEHTDPYHRPWYTVPHEPADGRQTEKRYQKLSKTLKNKLTREGNKKKNKLCLVKMTNSAVTQRRTRNFWISNMSQ
jgi:hypothetical protein